MTVIFQDDPPATSTTGCNFVPGICAGGFFLSSTETVTDLHFWLLELNAPGFEDEVTYTFYFDNAGQPGAPVPGGSDTVPATKTQWFGNPICVSDRVCYEVWIDITPGISLNPGDYWIGFNDPAIVGPWTLFTEPEPGEVVAISTDGGSTWSLFREFDLAVIITGGALIGGILIPIETTSLLLAGAQTFSWMIPVVLSVLGIGLFAVSRKSE